MQAAERGKVCLHVPVFSRPNHNSKDRNYHSVYAQTEILRYKEDRLLSWIPKSLQMVTAAMKLKEAYSLDGKL